VRNCTNKRNDVNIASRDEKSRTEGGGGEKGEEDTGGGDEMGNRRRRTGGANLEKV